MTTVFKALRDRKELLLVIGLPLASVLMGVVTVFFAYGGGDIEVATEAAKLSKTSWRADP